MKAQILLDRVGHSPGVIDGMMGSNTKRAIRAYQRARGMAETGAVGPDLLAALQSEHEGPLLVRYEISAEDVAGPFVSVPSDMTSQSKLDRLGFESPAEGLAEKFHMSQAFLKSLNPGVNFGEAGTTILVVANQPSDLPKVAKVEIDKAASEVRALDGNGKIVATYPATVGSGTFPSPNGTMEVRAIAPDPKYYFDPSGRDWGPDRNLTIAAGPNNPVGGTWIDLSKEGYGIHGTPDPALIGKTASHGCVRLTNWDAEELARAVEPGTKVVFL
ncbi:L,D-transpeptidase family protein [Sphingomonas xanthus]|uniref:L,D-transpeptidase family protein n=1 Tax=Sphingomonas xanthus TaxID=2594473 RepID=UPI001FE39DE4|nr:L,D-transpeptidase [Sphingomonas xanthus]